MADRPLINHVDVGEEKSKARVSNRIRVIGAVLFVAIIVGFVVAATRRLGGSTTVPSHTKIACPTSPAFMHATCSMTFEINDFMCKDVKEEIERRILGKDDWIDPKSRPGKYVLLDNKDQTLGSRTTGDGTNYVDKFLYTYLDMEGKGCFLTGCSVAQSASYYDYSTNYCNMHNLICGKAENCKVSRHDMRPAIEKYRSCSFHDPTMCTR